MRRSKVIVETVAMMARYNPFFERAGFCYLWDTASGRPVLFRGLVPKAEAAIQRFLTTDPAALHHRGHLYCPTLEPADPLAGPIQLLHVRKAYRRSLDVARLHPALQAVLRAFGVERRVVETVVLRHLDLDIQPRELVVLIGASGAGKTTLLRLLWAAASGQRGTRFRPDAGLIRIPQNVSPAALLPGELEPQWGREPLLQRIVEATGDVVAAMELLNAVGLSNTVLWRALPSELSTGQRERARLALLLAERPNLVLIDEFAAHLNPALAARVARKVAALLRRLAITAVIATHRPEVVAALEPDRVLVVGYGGIVQVGSPH